MVEGGPAIGESRALVNRLGLQGEVQFVGRVAYDEVKHYLAGAHCGHLLYSPSPYNTLVTHPVKAFEYMAFGLPVVCSNFPRLSAWVKDVGCGIAADPTDPTSIADALRRLALDPAYARELGEAGHRAFLERFNWDVVRPSYVGAFERAYSKAGAGRARAHFRTAVAGFGRHLRRQISRAFNCLDALIAGGGREP
jgi:glycosyltransferase involved in cell wall biosynthesis